MRQYEPEPIIGGTPISVRTVKQRGALIGKRIAWRSMGWPRVYYGTVEEVQGRNIKVDGDWKWAPDMSDVHVMEAA